MTNNTFSHLHVHTEYSMLDATSKVNDLVKTASKLGFSSLAMTDHGNMHGVLKFQNACKKCGIKPLVGCEVYTSNHLASEKIREEYHLVLIAKNLQGYHNLCKIVAGASRNFYYKPLVTKESLQEHAEGLICLSACIGGELPKAIIRGDMAEAERLAKWFHNLYGEDFYLEVQNHGLREEAIANKGIVELGRKLGIKLVATNDVHYVRREDAVSQDVLLCIQTQALLSDENRMRFPNDSFYLKSEAEMRELFAGIPEAVDNTAEVVSKVEAWELKRENLAPAYPKVPAGETEASYLRKICEANFAKKYPNDNGEARQRLEYELSIIESMGYSGYFLIVWDFIDYAENHGIVIGPGRGSGAGSIVSYLTGITKLDPLKYGLLFERFLNPERVSMPDIDTDIDDVGRPKVAAYMVETYKPENSAFITSFQTEAAKGAVRDVVRVMEKPFALGQRISKMIGKAESLDEAMEMAELKEAYANEPEVKEVIDLARRIEGLPRQTGTHAAGVVISQKPLDEVLPCSLQSSGYLNTGYDKDEVERLGLLKMDLLGLRNLSIMNTANLMIERKYGKKVDLNNLPLDDQKTMDMLKRGDTLGVFQLESSGMTELTRKLAPNEYRDMIPLVALYRPGPLGSGMVDDFIECRHGRKEISYMHPLLEPILKETFGVILYQEQVMKIVQVLAGFSLGQADIMRRAMGHKEPELLAKQEAHFVQGCMKNGIEESLAKRIFGLLTHFASYGFNKSHSAAYAYIAYQTAYLKANYPLEYLASYITYKYGNDEKMSESVLLCRKKGIGLLPVDITRSEWEFSPEGNALRLGFGAVKNLGESATRVILDERKAKPFASVMDAIVRCELSKANFTNLAKLGAFNSLYPEQAKLVSSAEEIYALAKEFIRKRKKAKKTNPDNGISLFGETELGEVQYPDIETVMAGGATGVLSQGQIAENEKTLLGFYVHNPLDACAETLRYCHNLEDILDNPQRYLNHRVNICGVRSEPRVITTKKGDPMAFMSVTVYGRSVDVVVFPSTFKSVSEDLVYGAKNIVLLEGATVTERDGKTQLVANKMRFKALV